MCLCVLYVFVRARWAPNCVPDDKYEEKCAVMVTVTVPWNKQGHLYSVIKGVGPTRRTSAVPELDRRQRAHTCDCATETDTVIEGNGHGDRGKRTQ